ncbi:MAG: hypothetical protein COY58_00600 [Gammaproteobacteria bacterium CG_4_10_14_0_8_um_filter_38_16]|nr:MAG: hypothetical protein COY58_00600 [Gammaproteobacteria bacterium CG_4_10_14_0_8_um_filter_38_16]PJA04258.1 MAG: hypothetical protein COX72_01400 [Gammaproteobacteria bacterium CG_4_10_14_0_2_um_filter_38_22]PJB10914.1 MAG: hypothetical protein CO120_02225 [Gammaproteobacteria bacterium CG_4_9_14_3_um_filter_38_9]
MEITSSIKIEPKSQIQYSKCILFLSMFYLVFFLSSAILAHKLVYFGNYMTSVSTFVLPFTFILADVIAEVYGYALSRQLIWAALLSEFLFAIIMLIAVSIHSPHALSNSGAYKTVFSSFTRIFIGNVIAMISSIFINIYAITKSKILLKGRFFWLRSLGASIVGEFIFTLICVIIAFAGVTPISDMPQLILTSFLFKVIFNPLAVIPASYLVPYLKKKENIDVYDTETDFNPIKIGSGSNNKKNISARVYAFQAKSK